MMSDRLTLRPLFRTALCLTGVLALILWGHCQRPGCRPWKRP